ncbi:MAG: exodeoxyribonuclease V subunit gamma [Parcubacteria group bacterium]|nr:exodeoxyribonuclease V subunit gamma [Parcubacteria group bacterium]MCR4342808.1 exodeoxyribonuclease V subunit gamma [Patescibacteria group bacterium]
MSSSELNKSQEAAALHKEGPLLIIAGAGAGKTKTIAHRIFNLVKEGVEPKNILAITFTNKAAKEMKERIIDLIKKDAPHLLQDSIPFVSTFHSLGVHIIKENSKAIGITRYFSILDKEDSLKAVKSAIKEANLDIKQFDPRRIQNTISRQKGELTDYETYLEEAGDEYFPKMLAIIWGNYENILKKQNALDFDDLILKTVILLQENPEILKYYQSLWKYIHIDEYQDTNKSQYTLTKLLSKEHKNICGVGDSDQSIYGWRGADFKNILNFEKDYPDVKLVLLEENYRSTKNILFAADKVIKKNKLRIDKNMFTKNKEGEKITLFEAENEEKEALFIAEEIEKIISKNKSEASGIAILYRANFQSRSLEEALLKKGIPYQILGVRFFERKEIKDILTFIKVALNPDDQEGLKRIINIPPRGIGKTTLLKIFSGKQNELPQKTEEKVNDFNKLLTSIKKSILTEKPSLVIKNVIKATGMEEFLKSGSEDDQERLENIRELVTLGLKYDDFEAPLGIEKLLTEASLVSDQDSIQEKNKAVRLMTVHSAKGLEFKYVFITGLEEGLFPHQDLGGKGEEHEEEERRLFYVALTRAKEKLYLSFADMRTIFGSKQVNYPSSFLSELPDHLIIFHNNDDAGEDLPTIEF